MNGLGNFVPIIIGDVVVVAIAIFIISRILTNNFKKEQQYKADSIVSAANEKSKTIELEARDKAMKILQQSESEAGRIARRTFRRRRTAAAPPA